MSGWGSENDEEVEKQLIEGLYRHTPDPSAPSAERIKFCRNCGHWYWRAQPLGWNPSVNGVWKMTRCPGKRDE